jgi:hypothetical protein
VLQTPSPHRFVIKKQPPVRKTPLAQEHTPRPSTQQFNATPRFNFSSTPRSTATQNFAGATPSATRYLTPASETPKEHDAIDTSSDDNVHDVHDSIETEEHDVNLGYLSADGEEDYRIEERGPKRRRLSFSPQDVKTKDFDEHDDNENNHDDLEDSVSSSLPILSSPPAPRRPISTTAPRFLISTPAPQSTPHPSNTPQTAFLKPPRFRPPDPSEQESRTDPLPEQFSPHRRGQKYLAGGLAAEVRDWLVNIESTIPGNVAQKSKDDPWTVKVMVDEISGGGRTGMTLVRGKQVHSDGGTATAVDLGPLKVILAGEGAGTGLQKGSKVELGKTVGVKGPTWEIVIEGEKWGVGVDWKVLSS